MGKYYFSLVLFVKQTTYFKTYTIKTDEDSMSDFSDIQLLLTIQSGYSDTNIQNKHKH